MHRFPLLAWRRLVPVNRFALTCHGLLISLSIISLSVFASEPRCDASLKVHLDLHAPSAYLDAQQQVAGMDADMARLILTKAGCEVEWHLWPMTGARIIRSLKDGELDVMIRASDTEKRREYAYFSRPYRQEVVGLFSLKRTELPSALTLDKALAAGLRLIGPASGWYGEHFQQLRSKWRALNLYTSYPDAAKGTELLFANPSRGDLILVDADIFFYSVGAARYESVIVHGSDLFVTPAHLMLRKEAVDEEDLLAIDQAIQMLRRDGRLQEIEKHYRPRPLLQMLLE